MVYRSSSLIRWISKGTENPPRPGFCATSHNLRIYFFSILILHEAIPSSSKCSAPVHAAPCKWPLSGPALSLSASMFYLSGATMLTYTVCMYANPIDHKLPHRTKMLVCVAGRHCWQASDTVFKSILYSLQQPLKELTNIHG